MYNSQLSWRLNSIKYSRATSRVRWRANQRFENHISARNVGKSKICLRTGHEGPEEQRHSSTLSLTLTLDGGVWLTPRPAALLPGKTLRTHCIGGWVGPRAGLDGCGKSRPPPPGFDPQTFQHVTSLYNVYVFRPFKTMVCSPFNHLTLLVARQYFIEIT